MDRGKLSPSKIQFTHLQWNYWDEINKISAKLSKTSILLTHKHNGT